LCPQSIGPDRQWTIPEDVTSALGAAPLCWSAAIVIAATATAREDARRRHASSRYDLPAVAIKTRIAAVVPMPNASVNTAPDNKK
jgi:hypothetical protein